uniref:Small nuclear ribonucleoprotein Sm-D3 n=1 Tax=Amorphochlora amoebiformis TaxID=1561963 RepID=A0A0H5BIQ3_9EUKA|nr:small nuclear ribonucleoprotein Sm-D3 [Amorphochlora amoebiformis]
MSNSYKSIGIPIKLIHEAEKHKITIVLKDNSIIKGELFNSEDNMNLHIKDCSLLIKNNKEILIQHIFVRGNTIKILIIPDVLKNSPMFKTLASRNLIKSIPTGLGILGRAGAADSIAKASLWK